MTLCDQHYDNIIFYDNLAESDKKQIDQHIKECPKCHKLWQEFRKVENGLNIMLNHVSDAMLSRYTVFLADPEFSDFDGKQLTEIEVERIESHTRSCDSCKKKLTELKREYQETAKYFEATDLPDLSLGKSELQVAENPKTSGLNFLEKLKETFEKLADEIEQKIFAPIPRLVPIGVGAIAALFAVIWFGPFMRSDNPYFHLTGIEADRVNLPTRGITSEDIGKSLAAYSAGEYDKSINLLESALTTETNDELKATGHYLLGLSYLHEAKTDILGRFQKVDQTIVEKAINNLQIAKDAGTNKATREECEWYIAKAYLLQGKAEEAKQVLQQLLDSQGRRYFDARALIEKINGIIQTE